MTIYKSNSIQFLHGDSHVHTFIQWRTKSGRPIPIGKVGWSPGERKTHHKRKIEGLKKRRTDKNKDVIDSQVRKRTELVGKLEKKKKRVKPESDFKEYSPDESQKMATEDFSDWRKGLKRSESNAIVEYGTGGYENINVHLRHGETVTSANMRDTKNIDSAFKKSPGSPTDMVVYRGMNNKFIFDNYESMKGATIGDKGFVSTTTSSAGANGFVRTARLKGSPVKAKILVPKGASVIEMHANEWASKLRKPSPTAGGFSKSVLIFEDEVLLNRGTKFKVRDATKKEGIVNVTMEVMQ